MSGSALPCAAHIPHSLPDGLARALRLRGLTFSNLRRHTRTRATVVFEDEAGTLWQVLASLPPPSDATFVDAFLAAFAEWERAHPEVAHAAAA